MDIKEFKTLRRHYGCVPAMRIMLSRDADLDVFQCDIYIGRFIEENSMGKVEKMTSKRLHTFIEDTVKEIKEERKNMMSVVKNRLVSTVLNKVKK